MTIESVNFKRAKFLLSAPTLRQCPEDSGCEVAFAGRSNAGKSSAINTLTQNKTMARTSKTPGRTQLINYFEVGDGKRLVDLPGYGYAKVPKAVKAKWDHHLAEYLQLRQSLVGLILLMDIRHPFKDLDQELIHWAVEANIPVLALLTKADKLKSGKRKQQLLFMQEAALAFCGDVTVKTFSSLNRLGLNDLERTLTEWLALDSEQA